jgi:Superfamily II DNA and RNA helicases
VITHTRELAVQVTREFEHFLKYFPSVTVKAIYGGEGSTSAEEQAV